MKPGNLAEAKVPNPAAKRKMRIQVSVRLRSESVRAHFFMLYLQKGRIIMEKRLFTSECVTNGHPDKVADTISDAILDACLQQDPGSRVACETMVTTDFCLICGEITTNAKVDYEAVAREAIRSIGDRKSVV